MKDKDREMENENLVQKSNHIQNAAKTTRNTRGSEHNDINVKTAANIKENSSDLTSTMERIYNKMVKKRANFLDSHVANPNLATTQSMTDSEAKIEAHAAGIMVEERDAGIALTSKDGMTLENYMRSL